MPISSSRAVVLRAGSNGRRRRRVTGRALCALALALVAARESAAAPKPIDPPAAPDAFAPALARTRTGVVASWIEPAAAAESGARASRIRVSRFDGEVWSTPVTVTESTALFANWADTPGLVESGDGALVAWWLEKLGASTYAYGIRLARSTDGGASWRPLGWLQDDLSESEHGFVSAVAEGASARFFWLDGRQAPAGGAMTLRTALVGEAVAVSTLVDDSVCDCCATAAAVATSGAVVAYRDRTPDEIRDIRLARLAPEGARSSAVAADGWKISGCPVNGPAVAVSEGRLLVAWFTGASDRARVAVAASEDGGASFASPVMVDEKGPLGRVGLVPLAGGGAVLAWYARAGEKAELRLARVGADATLASPLLLATTGGGRRSGVPRLGTLTDGRLLALWTEANEGPTRLRAALLPVTDLAAR
jgi:hypothetical protein